MRTSTNSKKWCVWDVELEEVSLRENTGLGYSFQYARSLAVAATKKYHRKFTVIEEPED